MLWLICRGGGNCRNFPQQSHHSIFLPATHEFPISPYPQYLLFSALWLFLFCSSDPNGGDVFSFYFWLAFPRGSDCKESACNAGGQKFNPWLRKIPWRREWQSTPVFLPGEFHGQRSLVVYSPQNHEESDTTEQLTLSLSFIQTELLFLLHNIYDPQPLEHEVRRRMVWSAI